MSDSPAPVTIESCRAPFSDALLDRIAAVQARAYAEIGLRPWSAPEIGELVRLDTSKLWIARTEETLTVGFLIASVLETEGEILALAVDPTHRKQKIGQRLVNELFQSAGNGKIEKIILEVAATNHPAIALYEILRFHQIGIRRDYYRIGCCRIDAKLMERRFD